MHMKSFAYLLLTLPALLAAPAFAEEGGILADCARITGDAARLRCYDDMMGRADPLAAKPLDSASTALAPLAPPATASEPDSGPSLHQALQNHATQSKSALNTAVGAKPEASELPVTLTMAQHWELGAENKRGVFNFRPHHSNYLIAVHSNSPNSEPYQGLRRFDPGTDLSHTEVAFQFGFKAKLVEDVLNRPIDLWFGYTQQSFWQASNHRASSPFRETNYQPEVMAVVPLEMRVLGLDARFLSLGFVHQSNGQASILSRSWNRLYAQVGLERDDFSLLARVWKRIEEDRDEDDNRDITDYMGHGDILATYRWEGHEFSALGRYNFRKGHGAAQLGWAFPLTTNLKGYMQVFSGYGQSLIEYDHAQQSIGLGVMLNY